ncbi:MAG TPA: Fic family protein [Ohtaekwangia sp.]|nr:Fic family protein [Ohtaekwangia sp.]
MSWTKVETPYNRLPDLPPNIDLESPAILKAAIEANRYLAELKGYCQTLPNPDLLLNTIVLQESKDSSAIENIVTTQDELYRAIINPLESQSAAKEVISYRKAVYTGLKTLKDKPVFTGSLAVTIMQRVKSTNAGFRDLTGIKLANPITQKIIYTPPDPEHVADKIAAWEKFINSETEVDPLIVMALMHYQFEAIHPFADGNGRTGRILNVLYLVHRELLTLPVLYHSAYIIQHKDDYYRKLRLVTEQEAWHDWILFMLQAVKETSVKTLKLIKDIMKLKEETLQKMKAKEMSQKLPAYELNELIFSFPYVKIKTLIEKNIAKRQTASVYLQQLTDKKILKSIKLGREVYYINHRLMNLLSATV